MTFPMFCPPSNKRMISILGRQRLPFYKFFKYITEKGLILSLLYGQLVIFFELIGIFQLKHEANPSAPESYQMQGSNFFLPPRPKVPWQ